MNVTRLTLTAGVLAGVLCSGVLEAAAQPQQPLLGCVKPGTGLLRIPPPSEGCKPGKRRWASMTYLCSSRSGLK